jgi:hypothetical protein
MKKKKLKKIITNSVLEGIKKYKEEIKKYKDESELVEVTSKDIYSDFDSSEYDPDVSEKFKKMILNIANYKNNINLNINHDRITISCEDVKGIKGRNKSTFNDDNYLEILIRRGYGFSVNNGYKLRSSYKDENIYDELLPELSEKMKLINNENFNNIWSKIMTDSGIIRDTNLEDILKENE